MVVLLVIRSQTQQYMRPGVDLTHPITTASWESCNHGHLIKKTYIFFIFSY